MSELSQEQHIKSLEDRFTPRSDNFHSVPTQGRTETPSTGLSSPSSSPPPAALPPSSSLLPPWPLTVMAVSGGIGDYVETVGQTPDEMEKVPSGLELGSDLVGLQTAFLGLVVQLLEDLDGR